MKNIPANVYEFWSNVQVANPSDPDSCWIWKGPIHKNGYGIYRTIYASQAAAIIYTGYLCERVRRPNRDKDSTYCDNRLCVRKEHFPLPFEKQPVDSKHLPIIEQPEVIKAVLDARGTGIYYIKDIAKKVHLKPESVKKILHKAPLYDILADVQNYLRNGQPVPITPDTRKMSHVS